MYMTFGQKQLNFKIGIVKIGKEFPYIQKVEKLVRKSPINFQNRNCQNFKKGVVRRNDHLVFEKCVRRQIREFLQPSYTGRRLLFQVSTPLQCFF